MYEEPVFDLEQAIASFRAGVSALPADAVDELESHLRDELDALAEVGIVGEAAFAHATLKLGAADELVDQIERAAPRAAWRAPAIALLSGVLVYLLGGAILAALDWAIVVIGYALRLGPKMAYVGIGACVVLGPFFTAAGGIALAPRLVQRVERAASWLRIAIVLAMGLFVAASHLPWVIAIRHNRELLLVWSGWRMLGHDAREIVYWSAPILISVAAVLARRRAVKGSERARFAFWALAGYLLVILGGATWRLASSCAAYLAELAGRDMERAATMTSVLAPLLLALTLFACSSRLAPPSRVVRSPLADGVGVALGLVCVAALFGDHALVFGVRHGSAGLDFPLLDAVIWSQFGTGILANLCLAPIAAAGLLRLRSA